MEQTKTKTDMIIKGCLKWVPGKANSRLYEVTNMSVMLLWCSCHLSFDLSFVYYKGGTSGFCLVECWTSITKLCLSCEGLTMCLVCLLLTALRKCFAEELTNHPVAYHHLAHRPHLHMSYLLDCVSKDVFPAVHLEKLDSLEHLPGELETLVRKALRCNVHIINL